MTGDVSGIDADDLSLLASGFEAAMSRGADPAATTAALFDLGWDDVLAASPAQAVATGFRALGATGSAVGILDDVLTHALGLEVSAEVAVVLPAPPVTTPPARHRGDVLTVDGVVTARLEHAAVAVLVVDAPSGAEVVSVDAGALRSASAPGRGLDAAFGRLRLDLDPASTTVVDADGQRAWPQAIAAGRGALAHQLVGASRTMLEMARRHAIDRVQFGRPVASFQAVRHRLSEALAAIEAADGVTGVLADEPDPLTAAVAKSLAGQAARTTAAHAQQVLAGIGFTTEHPFQLWMKRALVLDAVLGSAGSLPTEIGAELLRRGDAPRLVDL